MATEVTKIGDTMEEQTAADLRKRIAELEDQNAKLNEAGQNLIRIIQRTATQLSKASGELFSTIGQ